MLDLQFFMARMDLRKMVIMVIHNAVSKVHMILLDAMHFIPIDPMMTVPPIHLPNQVGIFYIST